MLDTLLLAESRGGVAKYLEPNPSDSEWTGGLVELVSSIGVILC